MSWNQISKWSYDVTYQLHPVLFPLFFPPFPFVLFPNLLFLSFILQQMELNFTESCFHVLIPSPSTDQTLWKRSPTFSLSLSLAFSFSLPRNLTEKALCQWHQMRRGELSKNFVSSCSWMPNITRQECRRFVRPRLISMMLWCSRANVFMILTFYSFIVTDLNWNLKSI